MEIISIHSKKKDYKVIIDNSLTKLIENELKIDGKCFVLIDKKVNRYVPAITENIKNVYICEVEGGESAKSVVRGEIIINKLLELNFSKNDTLIAFGGGTIGDLGGYIAATYKRGMRLINIPTTTLSAVDSSIGGKNALNFGAIKNVVGTIYPPEKVLIGLDAFESLDERNFNNGLYEALKMGIILDKELFNIFKNGKEKELLNEVISRSIEAKKNIVEQDEDNTGIRDILNFGHTVGHALESYTSFSLLHGEAIANGMMVVSKQSSYYEQLKTILLRMDCPLLNKIEDVDSIMNFIKNDKKVTENTVNLIVTNEIGTCQIAQADLNLLKGIIENYVI